MQKQNQDIAFSLPPLDQRSKNRSMEGQETAPQCRPGGGDADAGRLVSVAPDDFEFCILSSGRIVPAGEDDDADMCVAGEVFSGGKLLPLRPSSVSSTDSTAFLLLRSDSVDGATTVASTSGFSTRSDSRSASSSSSSSSSSRSTSLESASTDSVGRSDCSKSASIDAVVPPWRSLTNSLFYAHPSPSPRPPRRSGGWGASAAARRSTGSAPTVSSGIVLLGVVGTPGVYPPREAADPRKVAAAARGGSRSARFENPRTGAKQTPHVDKKLGLGLLGAGLACTCSADAVEPVDSAEAAAAATRQRRKKAEEKKKAAAKKSGHNIAGRSRILEWLEFSKNVAS